MESVAFAPTPPAEPGTLPAIRDHEESSANWAHEIAQNLEALADRVVGVAPTPETGKSTTIHPVVDGRLSAVVEQQKRLDDALRRITSAFTRLNDKL